MRRYVIFALAAPVVAWAAFVVIGRKRPDDAGTMIATSHGEVLPFRHGLAVEFAAVGVLAAYLTKRAA
jgi:hypothetical protein